MAKDSIQTNMGLIRALVYVEIQDSGPIYWKQGPGCSSGGVRGRHENETILVRVHTSVLWTPYRGVATRSHATSRDKWSLIGPWNSNTFLMCNTYEYRCTGWSSRAECLFRGLDLGTWWRSTCLCRFSGRKPILRRRGADCKEYKAQSAISKARHAASCQGHQSNV